jgi:hypothetical protein
MPDRLKILDLVKPELCVSLSFHLLFHTFVKCFHEVTSIVVIKLSDYLIVCSFSSVLVVSIYKTYERFRTLKLYTSSKLSPFLLLFV